MRVVVEVREKESLSKDEMKVTVGQGRQEELGDNHHVH